MYGNELDQIVLTIVVIVAGYGAGWATASISYAAYEEAKRLWKKYLR